MKPTLIAIAAMLICAAPASAAPASLGIRDSFRVGSEGVLCTAQWRGTDAALKTMFDRGYAIVCRDAASAVGRVFAFQGRASDPVARITTGRTDGLVCDAPLPVEISDLPGAKLARCRLASTGLNHFIYMVQRNADLFVAEGLAGYDSALRLALRSLVLDRELPGVVDVAATEAGDPAAFARVQAGNLDPDDALAQGYLRNNAASFAEAAEFFDLLVERNRASAAGFTRSSEYLANEALQQSNLGNFAEADTLFERARRLADPSDQLVFRFLRNFQAIHELNRARPDAALRRLTTATPLGDIAGLEAARLAKGYIDHPIAQRLNGDEDSIARLTGVGARLSAEERAAILDAQALYLKGAALRLSGQSAEARAALSRAIETFGGVRGGRVASIAWLKSGSLTELAAIAESEGKSAEARTALTQAVAIYAVEHPASAALLAARARLAALLARQGDREGAIALFRIIVGAAPATPGAAQAIRPLIGPYLALLDTRGGAADTADFFAASQMLARPGVAQTQAVLARELSGGSDEAAALFRQSLTLSRDIVRADVDIGRIASGAAGASTEPAVLAAARDRREALGRDQTDVLARLAAYPRYRVVVGNVPTLADLQAVLKEGDAYYKTVLVGDDAYGLFVTRRTARSFRLGSSVADLNASVAAIRDSIVRVENNQTVTYPFDVRASRALYLSLFGSVEAELRASKHLIFEPDGPLMQLPVTLLIAEQAGIDAYLKRAALGDADAFDMTGIAWLGRDHTVSTALSPRAFMDVRALAPSKGNRPFLGFAANAVPMVQNAAFVSGRDACDWPLAQWGRPIVDNELRIAARLLGAGGSDVVTGAGFSDDAILARADLRDFRVIHFATHGLVTAPRPDCPAEPALLTSFGRGESDGLLSFREIFDLRLDADTIILSACDTAGMATLSATRAAGVATGGNFALDGLVRAFIGAGARAVVASHWPVPDDFDATATLMTGLYANPGITGIGEALRGAQMHMMDNPVTSHPYYWAAFAVIGDGDKPVTTVADK
jgi:CHAT domain-containing protein